MLSATRRTVLRAGGLGLLGVLAGCQAIATTKSRERHKIDVENLSNESQAFTVRVLNETDDVLFEEEGSLAEGQQVARVFDGTLTTIRLRISDRPEQTFDWPTPSCADGEPAPKVEIAYGMSTSMTDARVFGRCEAILAD